MKKLSSGFAYILIILIIAVPLFLILVSYLIVGNPNPIHLLSLFDSNGYKGDMVQVDSLEPTTNGSVSDWKTYRNEEYGFEFKYPQEWIQKPAQIFGSGNEVNFIDPNGIYTLASVQRANYDQTTGKPYATIDEYINMPYTVKILQIDGQDARQPLPRAGSENIYTIYFFSKETSILGLSLEFPKDSGEEVYKEAENIFNQILSTFEFVEPLETNSKTYCESNKDCWCRSFDGTRFIPGEKVEGFCTLNTNKCIDCVYE